MRLELKHFTKPSYTHIFLYLLTGIVLWGITFLSNYFSMDSLALNTSSVSINELLINVLIFGITLINAVLLSQYLTLFSFIYSRSFIGIIIFFLLIIAWHTTHLNYTSHISLFLFILMLYQFLTMPHHEKPNEKAFLGSLFLGIASLLMKDLVFLLPFCWIGFIILHSLSLRTFLASLIGFIVPYILFLSANYIFLLTTDPLELLYDYNFNINFSLPDFSIADWIYVVFLIAIFTIVLISTYSEFNKKSIHTRRNLNFMLLMMAFFILSSFVYTGTSVLFLPIIGFLYAVPFAHVLSLKKGNFYSILFIVFFVINIVRILYNFIF